MSDYMITAGSAWLHEPLPDGRRNANMRFLRERNNDKQYLRVGTLLSDRYLVGKLLEHVGDAAIYIGFDRAQGGAILIREFLPDTLAERGENGELQIITGCENAFREYYEKFRAHARALARMRELPSIIPVYDIFEQNNTAYTISEYCEGNTLETRLKQIGGRMKWDEARPLFMPLLSTLISLHSAGVLHLGISPTTSLSATTANCSCGLLHYRGKAGKHRQNQPDFRLPAPEQYTFGQVGRWSDVYGLAATISGL